MRETARAVVLRVTVAHVGVVSRQLQVLSTCATRLAYRKLFREEERHISVLFQALYTFKELLLNSQFSMLNNDLGGSQWLKQIMGPSDRCPQAVLVVLAKSIGSRMPLHRALNSIRCV